MQFNGSDNYISTDDLSLAVNSSIVLQRPLLIKGEPGTGKTMLAEEVAASLGKRLIQWHIKSTTKAQQGLYEYDAVSRLRDSQLGDADVNDIGNYIDKGKLWEAFESDEQVVLLIDEIDKADIEFPNDLLVEIDKMEFFVYETGQTIKAKHRPIIIITSNNEKELPDAFLRRCFFHFINFPDRSTPCDAIIGGAPPRDRQERSGAGSIWKSFSKCAPGARPEEEAVHVGAARLAEAVDGGRYTRSKYSRTETTQKAIPPLVRSAC